ncbi:MAG: hypothetical protein AAF399_00230 [Bacteroidota bacterium]
MATGTRSQAMGRAGGRADREPGGETKPGPDHLSRGRYGLAWWIISKGWPPEP